MDCGETTFICTQGFKQQLPTVHSIRQHKAFKFMKNKKNQFVSCGCRPKQLGCSRTVVVLSMVE